MRIAVRSISALAGLVLALTLALTAFAADAVPTVEVSGVVLDTEGQPVEADTARVEEVETPDSEPIVTPIDVAADGTFTVALREWGTPEEPALARFVVFGPRGEPVVINDEGCTEMNTPFGTLEVAIPGVVPTEPVEIVLDQTTEEGLARRQRRHLSPRRRRLGARRSRSRRPTPGAHLGAVPGVTGAFAGLLFLAGTAALALAALVRRRAMGELSPRTVSSTRRRRPRGR